MNKGRPKGSKNPQINRYAAVRLRQRIAEQLRAGNLTGPITGYSVFALRGWIPNKSDGEPLEELGFRRQYLQVKKDLNHKHSLFFINFLHRAAVIAYRESHKRGNPPSGYNGVREIKLMTGLQEATIKDILILNGEIR